MKYQANTETQKGLLLSADLQEKLIYRSGTFYRCVAGKEPQAVCKVPASARERLCIRFRLMERLLRYEPRFGIRMENGSYLVSWNGGLFCLNTESRSFQKIFPYRNGMHNPLSITKATAVPGFRDGFLFGDYWGNSSMEAVSLYYCDGETVETVYTFPAGTVRHIHGLTADPKRERILIFTGDDDAESGIWEAKDGFRSVKPLLIGSQKYRSCAVYPLEDGLLYATDTPLCDNFIYFYDEKTKQLSTAYPLNGPCIYSEMTESPDGERFYLFATSVEPDSRRKGLSYTLSYRLGDGVHSRYATLVYGNPEKGFHEIFRCKKDLFPMVPFQFGNFRLPHSEDGKIYAVGQSVAGLDGKTICITK